MSTIRLAMFGALPAACLALLGLDWAVTTGHWTAAVAYALIELVASALVIVVLRSD